MPSKSKYTIYIVVHKGNPIDFSKYRHTGLWCVPEDGPLYYYFHVTGFTGGFIFERRQDFDPETSKTYAKKITVGKTKHSLTSSELGSLMESVSVANDDPEFSCQHWVDAALTALHYAGYLTAEQCNAGVDKMIDAIMEAEDERLV